MRALIRAELVARRRMLSGLSAGAFGILLIVAATYRSLGVDLLGQGFARRTPKSFSALSGTAGADLLTPQGWLGFGFAHPLFLVYSLTVAIAVPAAAIAGEVETGRAELLFVRPRGRQAFLGASIAVWAVAQLTVAAAACAGALLGAAFDPDVSGVGPGPIVVTALQGLTLFALVASVAFLASALARTRSQAAGVAIAVTAGLYLVNFVSSLVDGIGWLRWCSPFGYYEPVSTMSDGFAFGRAAVLLAASVLLLALAARALERRDLR